MVFIELGVILATLKAMGLKALVGKMTLAWKGLKVAQLKTLAYTALQTIQSQGAITAVKTLIDMLIILGTVAAGTSAYALATEAIEHFADGEIKQGVKKAAQARKEFEALGY